MRRLKIALVFVALGVGGYFWVVRGADSLCQAERVALTAVMPGAIDQLAVKYPLRVGLLRQTLDGDRRLQREILRKMANFRSDSKDSPSKLGCFYRAAQLRIFPSTAESRVAEELERRLGL